MNLLLDADYSAIQARVVCWLAGQEDALDEYRAQDAAQTKEEKKRLDRYRIMASEIYNVPIDEVNSFPQRFIGKQAILLSGFQGGPGAFRFGCEKFGYKDMPEGLEHLAVKKFRSKHKMIVKYWYDVEEAAQKAILKKGEKQIVRNVQFLCRDVEGMSFLLIRLPSGRKLAYPQPRLVPSRKFPDKLMIQFFGNIKRKTWGNCDTYAGKLVENITMGVEADILFHGLHGCERAGYEIATLIHDQALAYHKPHQTVEEFVKLLTDLPDWAKGLPLAAEGSLVPYYKKD